MAIEEIRPGQPPNHGVVSSPMVNGLGSFQPQNEKADERESIPSVAPGGEPGNGPAEAGPSAGEAPVPEKKPSIKTVKAK
jgi:hypothetical protein